jgi:hypothetical protein
MMQTLVEDFLQCLRHERGLWLRRDIETTSERCQPLAGG